jgi:hypothetical protein
MTAMRDGGRFTIAGPPPRLDGRRAYRGDPQLSLADHRILHAAGSDGLHVGHENGETVFRIGGRKQRQQSILRLLQLGYLLPADDGLFGDDDAQTLMVNTTAGRR